MPWNSHARCRAALLLALLAAISAKAQVYVAYQDKGVVNEYDADTGALIKEGFLSGLDQPSAICLDDGALYVLLPKVIAKYDAKTGAVLNDHIVSGFQGPAGAMTVHDGVVYLSSLAWDFQLKDVGPGTGNIIAKYDASTGARITASLIAQTDVVPRSLAVAGHTLFLAGIMERNPNRIFDITTGAAVARDYQPMLHGADFVTVSDDWVYFTVGHDDTDHGEICKYPASSDAAGTDPRSQARLFAPFAVHINSPGLIAVSGEEIFVGTGSGSGISKYNATTGEVINAAFIPDRGDKLAGLAVVPRAASGQYAVSNTAFAAKTGMMDWVYWAVDNSSSLYWIAACLVLLVVVAIALFVYYRTPEPLPEGVAATAAMAPVASEQAVTETPAPAPASAPGNPMSEFDVSAEVAHLQTPAPPAPPASVEPDFHGTAFLALCVVTLLAAAGLAWFAFQTQVNVASVFHHTSDTIGVWGIDPNEYHDPPIYYEVIISPTRLEYSGETKRVKLEGQWRSNGFWYAKPDGSGEVEVCHLDDPLNVTIHLSAFDSGEQGDVVVYKQRGTDDEMKALRDKYPQTVTYPPPAGVIKYWMSQYELDHLPWRADHEEMNMDDPVSRGRVWVYRSDNPRVPELRVTLKNHQVVKIEGGNG